MNKKVLILLILTTFISCNKEKEVAASPELLDAITSSSIAFRYSLDELQNFFQNPTKAYSSGYFYFEPDLAEDIIF